LLTEAISRSHPLSAEEAGKLVCELLRCLDGKRVVAEARRLNKEISELLLKMVAARYGAEAQVDGIPLATAVEEQQRQREEAREARQARLAWAEASGETAGSGFGAWDSGFAEADRPQSSSSPPIPNRESRTPPLPETLEEFQGLVARALDVEGEKHKYVVELLVHPLWERLQWWKFREQEETEQLQGHLQAGGATPPGSFEDVLNRMFDINILLSMPKAFVSRMNIPISGLKKNLEWWLSRRAQIMEGRLSSSSAAPPGKPPVSATPD